MRRAVMMWAAVVTCAGLAAGCSGGVEAEDVSAPSAPAAPTTGGAAGGEGSVGATEPVSEEALESLLPSVDDISAIDQGEWQDEGVSTPAPDDAESADKASPEKCERFFAKLDEQTVSSEQKRAIDFRRPVKPSDDTVSVTLSAYQQPQLMMTRVDHMENNWADCEQYTMSGIDMRLELVDLPDRGDGSSTVLMSYTDAVVGQRFIAVTYMSLGYVGAMVSLTSAEKPTNDLLLSYQDLVVRKVEAGGSS